MDGDEFDGFDADGWAIEEGSTATGTPTGLPAIMEQVRNHRSSPALDFGII